MGDAFFNAFLAVTIFITGPALLAFAYFVVADCRRRPH